MADDKPVLLYVTGPSTDMGARIAEVLLDHQLAACVNVVPGMTSHYVWNGERRHDSEVVILVKTTHARSEAAMAAIRGVHPYDNPAMLVLEPKGGSAQFMQWIVDACKGNPE